MDFDHMLSLVPVDCIAVDEKGDIAFSKWRGRMGEFVGRRFVSVLSSSHGHHDIVNDVSVEVDGVSCVASSSKINGWVAWFLMDISDQLRVEEDLYRSNKDLEQFAYAASHDLQEPLRMILRFSEVLEEELELSEEHQEYMNYIRDGATRMSKLVNGLLMYSRTGRNRSFREIDMMDVFNSAMSMLSGAVSESDAAVSADLPRVYGDEVMLTSMLQNLIGNSIKYATDRPEVSLGWTDLGTHWHIYVEDKSGGFDPKHSVEVFQMFRRVGHDRSGAGIGLAVCQKIASLHDGEIWASTEIGVGTTVHFTIRKPDAR